MSSGSYQQSFWVHVETTDTVAFAELPDLGEVELVITSMTGSASREGDIYVQMELDGQIRERKFDTHAVTIVPPDGLYLGLSARPTFRVGGEGEGPPLGTIMSLTVYGRIIDRSQAYKPPEGFNRPPAGRPGGYIAPPEDGGYYIDIRTDEPPP